MKIETKYSIGEKVHIVLKEDTDMYVHVYIGTIKEIVIKENDIIYYIDEICEEFNESDLVSYRDCLLANRIDRLLDKNATQIY